MTQQPAPEPPVQVIRTPGPHTALQRLSPAVINASWCGCDGFRSGHDDGTVGDRWTTWGHGGARVALRGRHLARGDARSPRSRMAMVCSVQEVRDATTHNGGHAAGRTGPDRGRQPCARRFYTRRTIMKRRDQRLGMLGAVLLLLAVLCSPGPSHAVAATDPVLAWNMIMRTTVTSSTYGDERIHPGSFGHHDASCDVRSRQRDRRGLRAVPWDDCSAARCVARSRGDRGRPSHAGAACIRIASSASMPRGPPRWLRLPDGPAKDAGIAVGEAAAEAILAAPGQRRRGVRGPARLHAGDRARRLAGDAAGSTRRASPAGGR